MSTRGGWILKYLAIGAVATLALQLPVAAEVVKKHPRVAQLEDALRESASVYLKARLPDSPFLVSVSVDPLRRASTSTGAGQREQLPFIDAAVEEMQDEWDDPQVTLQELIGRSNKISVSIALSTALTDNETIEVKEALMQSLHLLPARDEIKVNLRTWSSSSNKWFYPALAGALAFIMLAGFFVVLRATTSRLATALATHKPAGAGGAAPIVSAPMPSSGGFSRGDAGSTTIKGDVNLSDPMKARELMVGFVEQIQARPLFPSLAAIIELETYGKTNPNGLGAVIGELPEALKIRLYSLGSSKVWFTALNAPGLLTMRELELVQRIVREPLSGRTRAVEEMLIRVWRLGAELPTFLRTLPKDTAMAILAALPKGVAISAARRALPGAWAELLDPAFSPKALKDADAVKIAEQAESVRPLANITDFLRLKQEHELREHLRVASLEEEREVYLASRPDAAIHSMRPPFYVVLEASDEQLKDLVPRVKVEQWALALFNVERPLRAKIQAHMSEKQNFLLVERLKALDSASAAPEDVGEAREALGRLFKMLQPAETPKIAAVKTEAPRAVSKAA
jgi:hypothetical protein